MSYQSRRGITGGRGDDLVKHDVVHEVLNGNWECKEGIVVEIAEQ